MALLMPRLKVRVLLGMLSFPGELIMEMNLCNGHGVYKRQTCPKTNKPCNNCVKIEIEWMRKPHGKFYSTDSEGNFLYKGDCVNKQKSTS